MKRISLKFLFLLLAVSAVIALLVFEPMVRRARQDKAIASLASSTKDAEYDDRGNVIGIAVNTVSPPGSEQYVKRPIEKILSFPKLRTLSIYKSEIETLAPIGKLKGLETLTIERCRICDYADDQPLPITVLRFDDEDAVSRFPPMPNLERLAIGPASQGYWLSLDDEEPESEYDVDGFDFTKLKKFPSITKLQVVAMTIANVVGLDEFQQLQSLDILGCRVYGLRGVDKIPSLRHLRILSDGKPYPEVIELEPLLNCSQLQSLELPKEWSKTMLAKINSALPHCKIKQETE